MVHWIYPTILRKNWVLWNQTVWWISLLGVVTTVAGLWLGVSRLRVLKQGKSIHYLQSIYRLVAGASHLWNIYWFICFHLDAQWLVVYGSWSNIFATRPLPEQVSDYRGISIAQASESVSTNAFKTIKYFKEVEIIAVGGKTFVLSKTKNALELYESSNNQSLSPTKLTQEQVTKAVERAWQKAPVISAQKLENNDIYGKLHSRLLPDATLRIILDDPAQTWVHVNM